MSSLHFVLRFLQGPRGICANWSEGENFLEPQKILLCYRGTFHSFPHCFHFLPLPQGQLIFLANESKRAVIRRETIYLATPAPGATTFLSAYCTVAPLRIDRLSSPPLPQPPEGKCENGKKKTAANKVGALFSFPNVSLHESKCHSREILRLTFIRYSL